MSKTLEIEPVYVDVIPDVLSTGKLYISNKYSTATHLCACGCGVQVVTPFLREGTWTLSNFEGKVTLRPSIGNWSGQRPYHAHYYITNNKIEWL